MSLFELKNWFAFIQQAPENIRRYLETTFWVLVFLLLLWAILKILFNKQFKELYRIIGIGATKTGEVGKIVAREAVKNLELPEPWPRLTKFFAVVFMFNSYAVFFLFACSSLAVFAILVLSNTPSFWARTGSMLFLVGLGYFAWFFFAQAEKDRARLFKKDDSNNS